MKDATTDNKATGPQHTEVVNMKFMVGINGRKLLTVPCVQLID